MSILDSVQKWEQEQTFPKIFADQTGLPYADIHNYILEDTATLTQIGCKQRQSEFDQLAIDLAQSIEKATNILFDEEKSVLGELCYPVELIDLIKQQSSPLSYMRLGFIVPADGKPKLIEINSQTPSFNFELEGGTDTALQLLKKSPRNIAYLKHLQASLRDNLELCAEEIGKTLGDCSVGFLTCDSAEDIYQMNYLKQLVDELKIVQNTEVCTNLTFDFKQTIDKPFNSQTDTQFDILFNWYPLEFTHQSPYPDGSYFYELLRKSIESKKVAVYNGKSFLAQNKYLLVYMQENRLIDQHLLDYWTPSFYTLHDLEKAGIQSWIGKPIWGRQGAGIFGKQVISGQSVEFNGDMSDSYYNNQYYIYQQMWDSHPIAIKDVAHKGTLEKFVYKTKAGWLAGGQGMRISQKHIIDNESSWLIVE
jgi:glutathionylspermidine synthase